MNTKPLRLNGLVAATFTPMSNDGALRLDAVAPMVDHLCRWGVAGLYVVGSTGEGVSLSSAERMAAVEAFVQSAAGRVPIIVQVGHNSVAEACEMAAHAQRVGATAVSATPPSYFKPANLDLLVRTVAQIAGAAPSLPFYYYHIPHVTGVRVDMLEFLKQSSTAVPTLAGVKFTSPALDELLTCTQLESGAFEILSGFDELLLPALAIGVRGAVGSTYNFAAPIYHRVMEAWARGDLEEARLWQSRAVAMIRCVVGRHGLSGQKAVMKLIGLDCGPARLPLPQLDAEQVNLLQEELLSLGFFEWIAA
ncbi:MAG: dihydrodipicolinate synthase family protein [Patescibacteria group bacterium]|nr:dihydrodipicolinate synthase family protein [Patescibacteria group bacterium]